MSYSTNLNDQGIQKIIEKYKEFELPPTNNYTLFRAKYKSCTITIFKTKTILFQGLNESSVSQEICALADIEIAKEKSSNSSLSINLSLIGSDEVGTGDFFGGIVVAASYIPIELIPTIRRLGVKDSKELTDSKIQEIAPILMEKVKYSVLLLDNMKYNYVTKVKNMNMNKIKAFFDVYNLHPALKDAQDLIYKSEFESAAREAFVVVENYLKKNSRLDSHGFDLATRALSFEVDKQTGEIKRPPLIAINELKNESDRNEQDGIRYMLMGFFQGPRNLYQHNHIGSGVSNSISVIIEASFFLQESWRHAP